MARTLLLDGVALGYLDSEYISNLSKLSHLMFTMSQPHWPLSFLLVDMFFLPWLFPLPRTFFLWLHLSSVFRIQFQCYLSWPCYLKQLLPTLSTFITLYHLLFPLEYSPPYSRSYLFKYLIDWLPSYQNIMFKGLWFCLLYCWISAPRTMMSTW